MQEASEPEDDSEAEPSDEEEEDEGEHKVQGYDVMLRILEKAFKERATKKDKVPVAAMEILKLAARNVANQKSTRTVR
jgi:hypothetical protein